MVLPFLRDDCGDGGHGSRVIAMQGSELMLKMPEHDTLNRDGSGCDGICPEQAGDNAKRESANATKPIATTARPPTIPQLSGEYGPVPLLVSTELRELTDHVSRSDPSHENLAGVDANSAMLAGMVDLDDAVTEIFVDRLCERFHEA